MDRLQSFLEAREYLVDNIRPTIDVYLCDLWDPLCKFFIFKELDHIFDKDFAQMFPELEPQYRPNFKYRQFENENIEVNIQNFLNDSRGLTYLGSCSMEGTPYDLYYRESYDFSGPLFFAKYGHDNVSYFSGSRTAKAEYFLGAMTPLSIAYGMAIHDGFIE